MFFDLPSVAPYIQCWFVVSRTAPVSHFEMCFRYFLGPDVKISPRAQMSLTQMVNLQINTMGIQQWSSILLVGPEFVAETDPATWNK